MKFSHLHSHTQYSLLDGAASISGLYKKAVKDNIDKLPQQYKYLQEERKTPVNEWLNAYYILAKLYLLHNIQIL